MRPLADLIDDDDPAWPLVQRWLARGSTSHEVLPVTRGDAERALLALQVTTRSPLGALAWSCGGVLLDHGWLRLLGGGCDRLASIAAWNLDAAGAASFPGALIVAHDAAGGFFAINGGRWPGRPGSVYFRAPETLEWEDLERGHTDFVSFAAAGDMDAFYADVRWSGWRKDVQVLPPDRGFSWSPPLWTREGRDRTGRRAAVPMTELFGLGEDVREQLAGRSPS